MPQSYKLAPKKVPVSSPQRNVAPPNSCTNDKIPFMEGFNVFLFIIFTAVAITRRNKPYPESPRQSPKKIIKKGAKKGVKSNSL